MADLGSSTQPGTRLDLELYDNKELKDVGDTAIDDSLTGKAGYGCGADPDPLAHLPEHFRKEIEAQVTVASRKVSFKVLYCIASMINDRNSFGSRDVRRNY